MKQQEGLELQNEVLKLQREKLLISIEQSKVDLEKSKVALQAARDLHAIELHKQTKLAELEILAKERQLERHNQN